MILTYDDDSVTLANHGLWEHCSATAMLGKQGIYNNNISDQIDWRGREISIYLNKLSK